MTLEDVKTIKGPVVILFAGYFGTARLIDNVEVML
jgi:pantothenate synthetase